MRPGGRQWCYHKLVKATDISNFVGAIQIFNSK
jgi:hypothetical protein